MLALDTSTNRLTGLFLLPCLDNPPEPRLCWSLLPSLDGAPPAVVLTAWVARSSLSPRLSLLAELDEYEEEESDRWRPTAELPVAVCS